MTSPASIPATFSEFQPIMEKNLPGYRRRPAQEALAQGIEEIFAPGADADGIPPLLLAQAGTGTGKSLGAAIPAALRAAMGNPPVGTEKTGPSLNRTIIATTTIALMTQYAEKDLPFLQDQCQKAGINFTFAPFKGLSNFVCLSKLEQAPQIEGLDELVKELDVEAGNFESEHTGDRNDLATPLTSLEWAEVSSTSDECPGKDKCALAEWCFGMKHKQEAMDADVVITNTAMLMTDVKLFRQIRETSEQGEGKHVVVGDYRYLIIDEGHELEAVATDHLGADLKQGGVMKWTEQATSFINIHGGAEEGAEALAEKLDLRMQELGVILGQHLGKEDRAPIDVAFVSEHIGVFEQFANDLKRMLDKVDKAKVERGNKGAQNDRQKLLVTTGTNFLNSMIEVLEGEDHEVVRWVERYQLKDKSHRWVLKTAPINVGPILHEELWSQTPSVVMSATLSTGPGANGFNYMKRVLGMESAKTLDVGTPFDYPTQALLYYPAADVPDPTPNNREAWETWVPEATMALIEASGGGAMLLYTSKTAMNKAYKALAHRLEAKGLQCLLQGGGLTNKEIAARFKDDEDSILFGLRSFMTGVDFPGKANRLTIVDKLPFSVPDDPIFKAREEACRRRGGRPFYDLSVPTMTLVLQQAYGRLIRTVTDYGVVAILDPRLGTKSYGKQIVRALPDSAATTRMDDVRTFYAAWEEALRQAA